MESRDLHRLLERRKAPLPLAAIAAGLLLGAMVPQAGPVLESAVEPASAQPVMSKRARRLRSPELCRSSSWA